MSSSARPAFIESEDFRVTITPPHTKGTIFFDDGTSMLIYDGDRCTEEYLNYIVDAAMAPNLPRPMPVFYHGPQLYFTDEAS